jgi:hypothetical protein
MSARMPRRDAVGRPIPAGQDDAAGRCRHQCRDRARQQQPRRRRLVADRAGLRGRGNLLRPARRARRDRARAHRSRNAGAALPRHRRREWSDEPGFDEASWTTGVTGICGSAIIEVVAEMYLTGIISEDGVVDGALAALARASCPTAAPSPTCCAKGGDGEPRITVTQNDVRAIQLAKAALYAGIKLLMEKQGVETMSTRSALPAPSAPSSTRNTRWCWASSRTAICRGEGGRQRGRHRRADGAAQPRPPPRDREATVSRKIEKIETALEPNFQQLFIDAMALPNKVDPFPKLAERWRTSAAAAQGCSCNGR